MCRPKKFEMVIEHNTTSTSFPSRQWLHDWRLVGLVEKDKQNTSLRSCKCQILVDMYRTRFRINLLCFIDEVAEWRNHLSRVSWRRRRGSSIFTPNEQQHRLGKFATKSLKISTNFMWGYCQPKRVSALFLSVNNEQRKHHKTTQETKKRRDTW